MNDVKLLGQLTATPMLRKAKNGHDYAMFTVAVPQSNNRKKVDFIKCIAFDKLAQDTAEHCGGGHRILVNGRLQVSSTLDDDTKRVRYHHTVVASHIDFLHSACTETEKFAL